MCDAPQTTEALAVRRSRVVGGGEGFYLTQAIVQRFSKEYGSRSQGRWKDKGQGQDKAIPEAWNWKLKGRQSIMAGGWWHASGVCRVGAIVCVERPGPLPLMPSNQVGPRASSGMIVSDTLPLKRVHTSLTSFSACSDGLAAVFGRRRALNIRLGRRINNSILPESSLDDKKASVGRNLRTFCSASMHHV
jgi:hypothetical protein